MSKIHAVKSYHQALLLREQVERQGDVWVQPADGAVTHVMTRRYVMQAQCSDATGECYLQFFNDQVGSEASRTWPAVSEVRLTSFHGEHTLELNSTLKPTTDLTCPVQQYHRVVLPCDSLASWGVLQGRDKMCMTAGGSNEDINIDHPSQCPSRCSAAT